MSRSLASSIVDAVADALCVVPAWVLRGAFVLLLAGVTACGPLWVAIEILKQLGGLDR